MSLFADEDIVIKEIES